MSERVFYPDTNAGSSTSKVVALGIAVFRFNALTIQFASGRIRRGGRFTGRKPLNVCNCSV
jgi:hypothetical protein